MQPHIEAQRGDAVRRVLEAAARENLMICLTNCEELTDEAMEALNFAADSIRAIDPAQFRVNCRNLAPDHEAMCAKHRFPQPSRKDGGYPCGECHLKPGERCDICGARRP